MLKHALTGLICMVLVSALVLLFVARPGAEAELAPVTKSLPPATAPRPPTNPAQERFVGVVIPEEAVDISPRLDGRLESVRVQVGDRVRQGAVLTTLDTKTLQQELAMAEAELLSGRADLEVAQLSLEKAQEQLSRREDPKQLAVGAISQEELATARYEQRLAAAKVQAAQATLQQRQARIARIQQDMTEATLRAPFDGVVASRLLDAGALVRTGQPILHLLRSSTKRVRFAVPEQRQQRLGVGIPVYITIPEQGLALGGHVSHVAPEVDAASRMMIAVAEIEASDNPSTLASGAVVRVSLGQQEAP